VILGKIEKMSPPDSHDLHDYPFVAHSESY
jgi:hypothetical protein